MVWRRLDWSECVLDDALVVVRSPVRSDSSKTDVVVVSREDITPLPVHQSPQTAKSLCLVSRICQPPSVELDLDENLGVEDVASRGEEDEPREDVDDAAQTVGVAATQAASWAQTHREDGEEAEVKRLEVGPAHQLGQDHGTAADVAQQQHHQDQDGTDNSGFAGSLEARGGAGGGGGVGNAGPGGLQTSHCLVRSDGCQSHWSQSSTMRIRRVVGAAGLTSPSPADTGTVRPPSVIVKSINFKHFRRKTTSPPSSHLHNKINKTVA